TLLGETGFRVVRARLHSLAVRAFVASLTGPEAQCHQPQKNRQPMILILRLPKFLCFCLRACLVCREWQVAPNLVERAIRAALGRVVALAAEHVNIAEWVGRPVSCASARAHSVIHVVELKEINRSRDVSPWLIRVDGALPPNPLAGAQLILPDVVQEAEGL